MSSSTNKVFKGYAITGKHVFGRPCLHPELNTTLYTDASKWSEFQVVEFHGKTWEETDVEIAITHCG